MSDTKELPTVQTSNIGAYATQLLLKPCRQDQDERIVGMSYDDVLTLVRAKYPECKTTKKSLAWYNSHEKTAGMPVPIRSKVNLLVDGKDPLGIATPK